MRLITTLAIGLLSLGASAQLVEVKDVNAPPEDILSGRLRLPHPASCATHSTSAMLFSDELQPHHTTLDLIGAKAGVVLFGPGIEDWALKASTQQQAVIASGLLEQNPLTPGQPARAIDGTGVFGTMSFSLTPPTPEDRCAVLIADGHEDVVLTTHLDSHMTLVDHPVTLHADAGIDAIDFPTSEGEVTSPSGFAERLPLKHDGTLTFVPHEEGDWTVRTIATVTGVGRVHTRTTQHVIRVSAPLVVFDTPPRIDRDRLVVPVRTLGREGSLILAAELWGKDTGGTEVPVCWLARVQVLDSERQQQDLVIGYDPAWIASAGVDPRTLFVRELRAHDANGAALVAHVPNPAMGALTPIDTPGTTPKAALRTGAYVQGAPDRGGRSVGGHVIMFSHGYCSGGNPYDVSDFSGDSEVFLDINQNRSNNEFALLLEERGRDVKSMGIVAHSQGGNATAHLYTFYWSALDWAQGPRRIQCVGTPWHGTALAGSAAVLGDIFGAGCGTNTDLSYDGAALWLSLIPTSTRQEITFWTTSFEDRPFSFDYCQFATDFLLTDPEDGVVEMSSGQLPGANSGGHKDGWCHTTGMREPPQCTDETRNSEINQEAAR